jgi:hypothetical protein
MLKFLSNTLYYNRYMRLFGRYNQMNAKIWNKKRFWAAKCNNLNQKDIIA